MRFRAAIFAILMVFSVTIIDGQQVDVRTTWAVYIEHDIDAAGLDRLHFLNLLSGEIVQVDVNGERYTPLADTILFFDRQQQGMMLATPDGSIIAHSFIKLGAARRIDWIVSGDERLIAWTLTYDNADGVTTVTTVASPAGANQDLVLTDGPRRDGVRVLPVAFSVDNQSIIFDSQPDGIGDLAPYRQYANLFQLSLIDGSITPLPGEPSCFCAASLHAGRLIRLSVASDFQGFDVDVYDLEQGFQQTIESRGFASYTQGGNILISPDGQRAVYALSQVQLDADESAIRTVIMLVNLESASQSQLSQPFPSYLQAVTWTEDNTAVLYTVPGQSGTWKVDLATGDMLRVSDLSYIGQIKI